MTTACDLPIDLSTKGHHHSHHHHPHHHHHHHHGHGHHHHHHHHLLAAVHNHHHGDHHLDLHLRHNHQLHDAEELAFQQLQLEYLNHQQLCAAFANHPLNRLYAAASHHHSPPPPPHNQQHQFDQLTINTWSPPAHQLSQHLNLNSHNQQHNQHNHHHHESHHHQQQQQQQQEALCLNQADIIERARNDHELTRQVAAKIYERQQILDERDFSASGKRLDEGSIGDDEQLRKRRTDDDTCQRHKTATITLNEHCLERRHDEATTIIEENPSPIDLHRSSTSSTHSNASSPSSSSASITSTSSSSHSSSTFLGGSGGHHHHLQSGDKKRINRPLTGKHVKHGTGASVRTLVALRKVIRQRQQLSAK